MTSCFVFTDEPHRSSHLLEPAGARRSHRRDGDQRPGVVRAVERGDGGFCAQSYSKNLGLYAERIGAINAVVNDKETAEKTLSQVRVFLSLFAYCMGNWYDVVFCVHR